MTTSSYLVGGRRYELGTPDEHEFLAVVTGRVVDATVTGRWRGGVPEVETDHPALVTQGFADGRFAVSGHVATALSRLASAGESVRITLSAPRHEPRSLTVALVGSTPLPHDAGAVALRPQRTQLRGRTVEESAAPVRPPTPDATVTVGPVTQPLVQAVALRTPLCLPHARLDAVQACVFTATGTATTVGAVAPAGATTIELGVRTGLAAGSVLEIGGPVGTEHAVVADPGPSPLGAPGPVELTAPLYRTWPRTSPVQPAVPVVPGDPGFPPAPAYPNPATTLARDRTPGDGVLVLSGQLTADAVAIDHGAAGAEYRVVGAISDDDGYWALDGFADLGELELRAVATVTAGTVSAAPIVRPDYGQTANVIDLRLQ